jgi:hypothetical protein
MAKKKPSSESAAAETISPASPGTPRAPRRFQAFERLVVKRSTLHPHPNNPRTIDPHAFKKLRDFLKRRKLLSALQVNRRRASNGFDLSIDGQLCVIGGHQRLRAMDEIQGYDPSTLETRTTTDYDVPIDVTELSPAQESEAIVALNNPGLQGSWDYQLLSDLLTQPGVDPLSTGFDRAELAAFIDEGVLDELIGPAAGAQARADAPVLEQFDAIAEAGREADAANRAAKATVQVTASIPQPDAALAPEQQRQAEIDGMKERRQEYRESVNADMNAAGFMIHLVGDNDQQIQNVLAQLGLPAGEDFFPLADFMSRCGIQVE